MRRDGNAICTGGVTAEDDETTMVRGKGRRVTEMMDWGGWQWVAGDGCQLFRRDGSTRASEKRFNNNDNNNNQSGTPLSLSLHMASANLDDLA